MAISRDFFLRARVVFTSFLFLCKISFYFFLLVFGRGVPGPRSGHLLRILA